MRIAFMGAHGVGKTTLINELKKYFNFPVIPEIARQVIQEMKKHPLQMTMKERLIFEQEILKRQIELEDKYRSFISDRTVLDIIAYCNLLGLHIHFPDEYREMKKIAVMQAKNYDVIFFIPVHKDLLLVNDGVRYECESCRYLVDALLKEMAEIFISEHLVRKIYYVDVLELDERVKFVLSVLKTRRAEIPKRKLNEVG
jgi:predicted ATPase